MDFIARASRAVVAINVMSGRAPNAFSGLEASLGGCGDPLWRPSRARHTSLDLADPAENRAVA